MASASATLRSSTLALLMLFLGLRQQTAGLRSQQTMLGDEAELDSQVSQSEKPTLKVAVWTINLGSYDKKEPYKCVRIFGDVQNPPTLNGKQLKFSCHFITDNQDTAKMVEHLGWQATLVHTGKSHHLMHLQRKIKVFGNLLKFGEKGYDYSIYHDANMWPVVAEGPKPAAELIVDALKPMEDDANLDIVSFHHPHRSTVSEEREELGRLGLCTPTELNQNRALYDAAADFKGTQGLLESSVFIRRASFSPTLKKGLLTWYETMDNIGCYRDQIAFDYAMWTQKVQFHLIKFDNRPWRRIAGEHSDPNRLRFSVGASQEVAPAAKEPQVQSIALVPHPSPGG